MYAVISENSIKSKEEYIISLEEELQELQNLYDKNLIDKVQLREIKRKKILHTSELNELKIDKSSLLVNITQNKEEILKIRNNATVKPRSLVILVDKKVFVKSKLICTNNTDPVE